MPILPAGRRVLITGGTGTTSVTTGMPPEIRAEVAAARELALAS